MQLCSYWSYISKHGKFLNAQLLKYVDFKDVGSIVKRLKKRSGHILKKFIVTFVDWQRLLENARHHFENLIICRSMYHL